MLFRSFNPHHGECPRVVLCCYFGNEFTEVVHCSEHCDPGPLETHLAVVKDYMAVMAGRKPKKSKQVGHLPGENFRKAPNDLHNYVRGKLLSWREDVWRKRPFSFDSPDDISPEVIIGEGDIHTLAEWLYTISTCEHLDLVVKTWISVTPLSEAEIDGLWAKVQAVNGELKELIIRQEEVAEAQKKKSTRRKGIMEKPPMSHASNSIEEMVSDRGLVQAERLKEQEPTGEGGKCNRCVKR